MAETAEPGTDHITPHQAHQGQPRPHQHQHAATAAPDLTRSASTNSSVPASPLDLAFRDEEGRSVTLRQLIDGPTIIAPVYYSCPNVCAFLQADRSLPTCRRSNCSRGKARVLSVSF
ncbi:MAG: hypothetical protein R2864_05700 [Syntrophotaleaceae bacterium]